MAKKIIMWAGICYLLIVGSYSLATPKSDYYRWFYRANSLYDVGNYTQAIANYEKILEKGYESGNLYYNIGNAFFKQGELGKAILYYERAKKLIPRDRDLEANYRYALSLVKQRITSSKGWLKKVITKIAKEFTINELTIFITFLYSLTLVLIILNLYVAFIRRWFLYVLICILILSVVTSLGLYNKIIINGKEGIIIVERTDAKFEPFSNATTHFNLYEGYKVYILSQQGDWYKIKRIDGKIGWIEKKSLGII